MGGKKVTVRYATRLPEYMEQKMTTESHQQMSHSLTHASCTSPNKGRRLTHQSRHTCHSRGSPEGSSQEVLKMEKEERENEQKVSGTKAVKEDW
ncbi:hypothetical protein Pcinc_028853 [Petrolisthes cinctipes]|uniref:Uncharacterized protein n=1 Tax=Petrolisthes cinctipes TaxID=88211 RepID=A0AAE1F1K4_PETCI|nr:hypothetical protein Pcinc_028853 [Petrolisthes cinctipes]